MNSNRLLFNSIRLLSAIVSGTITGIIVVSMISYIRGDLNWENTLIIFSGGSFLFIFLSFINRTSRILLCCFTGLGIIASWLIIIVHPKFVYIIMSYPPLSAIQITSIMVPIMASGIIVTILVVLIANLPFLMDEIELDS
jgi:hypothetical protein